MEEFLKIKTEQFGEKLNKLFQEVVEEHFEDLKAAELKRLEDIKNVRPDQVYNNLKQVDSIMLKAIYSIEDGIDAEAGKYIYPALWEVMRNIVADYSQNINTLMMTHITCLVKAIIEADKINPIQKEEDRPQLAEEDLKKNMINAQPPELPNCLKDPYKEPDSRIIDVNPYFKYNGFESVDTVIDESIKQAEGYLEHSGLSGDITIITEVADAFRSSEKIQEYIAAGAASLVEMDGITEEISKVIKEKKGLMKSKKLDEKYANIIESLKWIIFVMPQPMQDYVMQIYQAQQQMAAQQALNQHNASMKVVKGAGSAPKGGKGPGSLRVVPNKK